MNKKTHILLLLSALFLSFSFGCALDNGYRIEQGRFSKVLQRASDEELFIVLKYAIAHGFVPNRQVDPFFDKYVTVRPWQRSLKVYNKLLERKDLLRQIYPDLRVLDEYVKWGWQTGEPYPDTAVSNAILHNVQKDIKQLDSLMESPSYKSSLEYKYFGTPFLIR